MDDKENFDPSKVDLKHCPFCGVGNSQVELYLRDDFTGYWTIGCGACGSHSGIHKDPMKVVSSWNSRPHEVRFSKG